MKKTMLASVLLIVLFASSCIEVREHHRYYRHKHHYYMHHVY